MDSRLKSRLEFNTICPSCGDASESSFRANPLGLTAGADRLIWIGCFNCGFYMGSTVEYTTALLRMWNEASRPAVPGRKEKK